MSDTTHSSSPLVKFLRGIWLAIDFSRRLLMNLLFLIILTVIVVALLMPGKPAVTEKTALVIPFDGPVVEQRAGASRSKLIEQALADPPRGMQLRDLFTVLDAAAKDPKIDRVVLVFDDFGGTGLATLREVGAALQRFKAAGKQVVAWSESYNQQGFYVAAHANEVYLHPMGMVYLRGFGGHRNYYKDALDRAGISVNVLRVGSYKNFGETYVASQPSKETLESDKYLYDDLWQTYTAGVEKARALPAGSIDKGIDAVVAALTAAGGNAAQVALDAKLVSGLKTRDELRALMIERGAEDKDKKTFRQVSFHNYLASIRPRLFGDAIGVVVAQGSIVDGDAPPGTVGGRSTAELIRKARDDEKIKAVVLRVDSPGGSAFASEQVRHELALTRAAGKPVVVSMGDVAASGGYWIAMAADEVIADAATITGSIGVVAMLPTAEKTMDKLSLKTGGYTTTWLAGAEYDPRRALDPRFAELVKVSIGRIYTDFTTLAAKARNTTPDKIDAVAQGRVWTGGQAKERGLVDRTGSFADAIAAARTRAKLPDDVRVTYIDADRGKLAMLIEQFGSQVAQQFAARIQDELLPRGAPGAVLRDMHQELAWLSGLAGGGSQPFAVVAHCLCEEP